MDATKASVGLNAWNLKICGVGLAQNLGKKQKFARLMINAMIQSANVKVLAADDSIKIIKQSLIISY
jgi:hypothetical protein